MPVSCIRVAVLLVAALCAGCGGTSRVGDELTTTSLTQSKKAVALIKLGAADPLCTTLTAGIGVREGEGYRLLQTARIVRNANEASVAELELASGEYHIVSYMCTRQRGALYLAQPAGNGVFKKSYASFTVAPGEIVNVGFLQMVAMGAVPVARANYVHIRIAVTDWPLAELDRFKQQRPKLYTQMKTRLMAVAKVELPTVEQIRAKCAEMKKLQVEGKLQNLPSLCTLPSQTPTKPGIAKKEVGA
jgi:hypothetical protein